MRSSPIVVPGYTLVKLPTHAVIAYNEGMLCKRSGNGIIIPGEKRLVSFFVTLTKDWCFKK
jgi:hypothetical protein